ncbi:hypothetical protein M427DRAFT_57580 [Gonapodya prolifera JEL478]|uniref:J domain-containing protein n=1 Tax=Gonapodya prolifera (strain JEL478) TaxID=1344416 RepID=A0A139ACU8_GONPJ|nr:hypothetical protein M427DRAFT_57580 [Gonapodya prolifera JEL478]|eukprot:KXS14404.1 hypothetical protein M427DRAFT_57580 [Gonapodya prolifera JEL478]
MRDDEARRILNVSSTATLAEIKAAYILLAKETHPDVSRAQGPDPFLRVSEAYERLTKPRPLATIGQHRYHSAGGRGAYSSGSGGSYNEPWWFVNRKYRAYFPVVKMLVLATLFVTHESRLLAQRKKMRALREDDERGFADMLERLDTNSRKAH